MEDGNTLVIMDWVNITVKEGATTSAAIFNNLFGILSRPTDFFSSIDINNLQTVAIVGVCIEKVLFLRVRYDSGVNFRDDISAARFIPTSDGQMLNVFQLILQVYGLATCAWGENVHSEVQQGKTLNKRTELFAECHHNNNFCARNFKYALNVGNLKFKV